jgi:phage tail protein X
MNKLSSKVTAGFAVLVGFLTYASAAHADIIDTTISNAQGTIVGYTTAVLSAIVGLAVLAAGIRIAPRVIKVLAAKVAG